MSNAALSLQTKKLYPNQFGCNFFLLLYITNGHFHNSYWSIYCNSKLGTTPLYDKLKMTENKSVEKSFEDSGDFFPPRVLISMFSWHSSRMLIMVLLLQMYLCIKGTVRLKVQVQQHLFLFWFKTSMGQKRSIIIVVHTTEFIWWFLSVSSLTVKFREISVLGELFF